MKNPDPNHIKIDEKQYKNIIVYCDGYERPHSAKPLKLFINKKKDTLQILINSSI